MAATWYVRADATADTNPGTGPGTTQAVQKIQTAVNKAGPNDTVYIAPGVYRALIVPSVNGSSGSPINIIGNTDGSIFGVTPGRVRATSYTVNDTTVPTAGTTLLSFNSAGSYTSWSNIEFHTVTSAYIVDANQVGHDVTFTDCTFIWSGGGTAFRLNNPGTTGSPLNFTFDRCRMLLTSFNGTGTNFIIYMTANKSTVADFPLGVLFRNCFIVSLAGGSVITVNTTGAGTFLPGGVTMQNCTILCSGGAVVTTNPTSTTYPIKVYNCLIINNATPLNANGAGQIVEDYNVIYSSNNRANVTTGTHSKSDGSYALTVEMGQGWGQFPHSYFLAPEENSPLLNFGNDTVNVGATNVDLRNRQRPSGGALAGIGCLERHDIAVQNTTTVPSGQTNSAALATAGDSEFLVPVPASATTISIQVYRDASYGGGTLPTLELLAAAELGVTTQSVTDTGAASTWNTITLAPFTPTKAGVVKLRLHSYAAAGGNAYWGKASVPTLSTTTGTQNLDYWLRGLSFPALTHDASASGGGGGAGGLEMSITTKSFGQVGDSVAAYVPSGSVGRLNIEGGFTGTIKFSLDQGSGPSPVTLTNVNDSSTNNQATVASSWKFSPGPGQGGNLYATAGPWNSNQPDAIVSIVVSLST